MTSRHQWQLSHWVLLAPLAMAENHSHRLYWQRDHSVIDSKHGS